MGNLESKVEDYLSSSKEIPTLEDNTNQKIIPLFFPSKENELEMIKAIKLCRKRMRICVYTVTNKNIIDAIINLTQLNQNLQIQLITDDVQNKIPSQKALLEKLLSSSNQIQVKLDNSPASLMHNKYLIIDDLCVITGSFNWTNKAVTTNRENVVIIIDKNTTAKFNQNFEELWALFKQYNIGDGDNDQAVHNRPYYGQKNDKKNKNQNKNDEIPTGKGGVKPAKEKTPRQKVEQQIKKSMAIKKKKETIKKETKRKQNISDSDDDFDPLQIENSNQDYSMESD